MSIMLHTSDNMRRMSDQVNPKPALTFGEWLEDQMVAHGLNQSDFAYSIGVNQSTVSNWLNNKAQPTRQNLRRIAAALGLQESTVLRRAGHTASNPPPPVVRPIPPTPEVEKELEVWLETGRRLSPAQRRRLIQFIESLEADEEDTE